MSRQGIVRRTDPMLCERVACVEQPVFSDLVGPDLIIPYPTIGTNRDTSIDERAATKAAPEKNVHVIAQAHII